MPEEIEKEKDCYTKLVEGFSLVGEALQEMQDDDKPYPIKLLISRMVGRMGLNNQELLDELTMIRFAVENNDYSLDKLTAYMLKSGKNAESN